MAGLPASYPSRKQRACVACVFTRDVPKSGRVAFVFTRALPVEMAGLPAFYPSRNKRRFSLVLPFVFLLCACLTREFQWGSSCPIQRQRRSMAGFPAFPHSEIEFQCVFSWRGGS